MREADRRDFQIHRADPGALRLEPVKSVRGIFVERQNCDVREPLDLAEELPVGLQLVTASFATIDFSQPALRDFLDGDEADENVGVRRCEAQIRPAISYLWLK